MNIPVRLGHALAKLYPAFYENTLNPECCKQCAVGTILDNSDAWKHFSDHHGTLHLNYVGLVHERLGRRYNGYAPSELLAIEKSFLEGCGYRTPFYYKTKLQVTNVSKEQLFDGMCAVITTLCSLDAISNIMEFKQLLYPEYHPKTPLHSF